MWGPLVVRPLVSPVSTLVWTFTGTDINLKAFETVRGLRVLFGPKLIWDVPTCIRCRKLYCPIESWPLFFFFFGNPPLWHPLEDKNHLICLVVSPKSSISDGMGVHLCLCYEQLTHLNSQIMNTEYCFVQYRFWVTYAAAHPHLNITRNQGQTKLHHKADQC